MKTPSLVTLRQGSRTIDRVVELAMHHLAMDVAYVVELTDRGAVAHHICGDPTSFDLTVPGACVSVPLRLTDGTMYGSLCALRREPDETLDQRDVRFLEMLAELIVDELRTEQERESQQRAIAELIDSASLRVACQPIVDLRDGRCIGVEALARFPHPYEDTERTFALAHEVGLGLELERLAAVYAWNQRRRIRPDQFVSINLSPDAALRLAHTARDYDALPLDQTVLEITEHAVVSSYRALRNELEPMRESGLRVAIDDAGAGYASLQHVVELQPDFIKIDRSFVDHIAVDRARRSTVSSFVVLALDLDAAIIAEGVETADDLAALRDLGVHAAQGYLLARPSVDRADLARWAAPSPVTVAVPASESQAGSGRALELVARSDLRCAQ